MTALSDVMIAVPTFLLQASYSRDKETAADAYAFRQMSRHGIDPKHFASIIRRLGDGAPDDSRSWLSSHPITAERAKKALQASKAFNPAQ